MGRFTYDYPRPSATVDLALFGLDGGAVRLLLVRRGSDPFAGRWALPGGFVNIDEPFEDAARRELKEETGVDASGSLGFVGLFGDPGRDPRGRTLGVAHAATIRGPLPKAEGSDDAADAGWKSPKGLSGLAFDHDRIVAAAVRWLVASVSDGPAGLGLLPASFGAADVARMLGAVGELAGGGFEVDAEGWIARQAEAGRLRKGRKVGTHAARAVRGETTRYDYPFR